MENSEPNVLVLAMDKVGCETAVRLSSEHHILLLDCSGGEGCRVVSCDQGQSHLIESCQSTSLSETEVAVASRLERTFAADTLVVIAGASGGDDWLENVSTFERAFERDFFLPLVAMKAVVPRMVARKAGRIVVVLPRSALFVDAHNASATCAHWALRRVCQSLLAEIGQCNVEVRVVFASQQRHNGSASRASGAHEADRLSTEIMRTLNGADDNTDPMHVRDRLRYVRRQLLPNGVRMDTRWGRQTVPCKTVITGASSGLGRELARRYARHADVLHLVGRDVEAMEQLQRDIATGTRCDIRIDRVDLADATATADYATRLEGVDALINCAGFSVVGEIADIPLKWFRRNMAVNFIAPVILATALLRKRVTPKQIVNVLSTTAVAGRKGHGCYSATKAALWAFTQILRDTVPSGVQVVEAIPATFASGFAGNTVKVPVAQRTEHSERITSGTGHKLTSAMVAERIDKAIRHGRQRIYVPFKARGFLSLEAVAPALFKRLFA